MKKIILTALAAISIFGCQSDDNEPLDENNNNNNNNEPVAVAFTVIADSDVEGGTEWFPTASNHVISDEAGWNDLIAQINSINEYALQNAETDVDFSAYKVIAVIDEFHSSGNSQYDIAITSVTQENGQLVVDVHHTVPAGENVTAAQTQPIYIIKIPQSNLPVVFE